MPGKKVLPLNNPSPRTAVTVVKTFNTSDDDVSGIKRMGVKEVAKKPSGGVKLAEALLKCPRCGRIHKLIFRSGTPPNWERCTWCDELQPTDGFRVIAYGLGLPQPQAKHEIAARADFLAEVERR